MHPRLQPGETITFNNRRMLHGREPFQPPKVRDALALRTCWRQQPAGPRGYQWLGSWRVFT